MTKPTGLLSKRSVSELLPLVFGGKQENGLRTGIVAAGYAIEESVSEMVDTANVNEDHFAGYIVKSI